MSRPWSTKRAAVIVLVVIAPIAGCSERQPKLVPASGTVMLGDELVAGGIVEFASDDGFATHAVLDSQGRFTLRSQFGGGIPVGRYRIAVLPKPVRDASQMVQERPSTTPQSEFSKIPIRYHEFATSGLTADVKQGGDKIELRLSSR